MVSEFFSLNTRSVPAVKLAVSSHSTHDRLTNDGYRLPHSHLERSAINQEDKANAHTAAIGRYLKLGLVLTGALSNETKRKETIWSLKQKNKDLRLFSMQLWYTEVNRLLATISEISYELAGISYN